MTMQRFKVKCADPACAEHAEMVMASDYDALAVELAEAKRQLGLSGSARIAMLSAHVEKLEAALHKAFNQFENITVAADLKTAHDRAHSFIGWAYANLPGYAQETVSTLCAVCDQIKELHPATHPWTAITNSVPVSSKSASASERSSEAK